MIEVKQGPYAGEQDKTRFKGIGRSDVKLAPEMLRSREKAGLTEGRKNEKRGAYQ